MKILNPVGTLGVHLDPIQQTVYMLLDIQENETIMKGRKTFKGNAQLQRIIEYLVNSD